MDRDKVTFRANQPELVTLDRDNGKEVAGRNGPQFMRILDGDTRILFADPELENAIIGSGARKGDVIRIVKRAGGWDVGIMPNTSTARPDRFARQLPAEAHPSDWRQPESHQPATSHAITPQAVKPMAAFETAILTAEHAVKFARARGIEMRFDFQDVRAIANSILCSEGGR